MRTTLGMAALAVSALASGCGGDAQSSSAAPAMTTAALPVTTTAAV
ncbi:calcium-binding protein, partial [Rhodococcus opacus]